MDAGVLYADGKPIYSGKGKIVVAGAGKGAAPMGQALEKLLGERISSGLLVVKYGHAAPTGRVSIVEASHPVPDAAGMAGAAKLLDLAFPLGPDDLLICLFTGGASSLLPAPVEGLSLEDIQRTTKLLLESGTEIQELNAIRKHLSRIGGGQLARAANEAKILSVIVSDVIGDDLGAIASGPTAPDDSTFSGCLAIIQKYNLENKLPPAVMACLRKGAEGGLAETPKADDDLFTNVENVIIASNRQALAAARQKAGNLGFEAIVIGEPMQGEAREMAERLMAMAKNKQKKLKSGSRPICLIAGGETTVTIKGSGLGGRNQEMALAASIALEDSQGIYALFAGTDGTDGPTDAAGGFAFPDSSKRMNGQAEKYLANNNSNAALRMAGDLLITGPTLTNVMDIAIVLVEKPEEK